MQVARQIALSTKVASRAYGAPFAKNLPLHSGFSGLLRFPHQSPNTQNSSAATPRSGATLGETSHLSTIVKRSKNKNELVLIVLENLKKYGKVKGIMIYLIRCSMYIACMICNSKQQFICDRNGGASDVINIWNHCLDFSEYGGDLCCRR